MPRTASTANEAALAATAVELVVMVDLDFASGMVRLHDGIGNIAWNGNTYEGLGTLGGIDAVQEELETTARQVRLSLSGVDNAIVALARDEVYQNRSAAAYLGLVRNGALIDAPETIWEGRMDYMSVRLGEKTGAIELNCEHRLRREPRIARYTDADQRLAFADDTFFVHTTAIQNYTSNWGSDRVSYGGGQSGIGTGRPIVRER